MLIAGDRVIVVGYSYARGGTEINRFRLDAAGRLRFEDAYHLRSNDYYSSRNYASRLIGNRLIFYTPLYLDWRRRSARGAARHPPLGAATPTERPFRRIASARADLHRRRCCATAADAEIETLHSVTNCDLDRADARLLGDRRARPGIAHLLRLAATPSICGSPTPGTSRRRREPRRLRLPAAVRARAAVGDRRARRAGRSILVPRGSRPTAC